MAILPHLDEFAEKFGLSHDQKVIIAITQWSTLAYGAIVLAWLIWNVWTILIKNRKYQVLSLTTFYVVAGTLILFRMENAVWIWQNIDQARLLTSLFPIVSKFSIGIN